MNSPHTEVSDNELIERLGKDDRLAFDDIYKRYWSIVFQAAYRIVGDKEACMDIVQELFIWLWEHRADLSIISVKAYLLVAVKFKVSNYIRNGKVRASFFDELKRIDEPTTLATDDLEVKELLAVIEHFTNELPDKCREIFLLSRHEHLTNKQIADRLGISVKTVENQMTIALKRLRASLGKLACLIM